MFLQEIPHLHFPASLCTYNAVSQKQRHTFCNHAQIQQAYPSLQSLHPSRRMKTSWSKVRIARYKQQSNICTCKSRILRLSSFLSSTCVTCDICSYPWMHKRLLCRWLADGGRWHKENCVGRMQCAYQSFLAFSVACFCDRISQVRSEVGFWWLMALEDITCVDIYISFVLHFRFAFRCFEILTLIEDGSQRAAEYEEADAYTFFIIVAVVLFQIADSVVTRSSRCRVFCSNPVASLFLYSISIASRITLYTGPIELLYNKPSAGAVA